MRTFRRLLKGPLGQAITIGLIAANGWAFSGPQNYLEVLEAQQKREAEIREIAKKMNVDPDFLLNPGGRRSFDWKSVFNTIAATLGVTDSNANANAQPLDIRESIGRVKSGYALVAADTTVARIAELVQISLAPDAVRGKKKGQIKAELQSVLRLVDKDFLPALRDGLPGVANGRDAKARAGVDELRRVTKAIINAPHALDDANIDATLTQLRSAVSGNLTVRNTKPRWTKDPFPVKDTYKSAPKKQLTQRYDGAASVATPAVITASANTPASTTASARLTSNAVSSEVAALAATLVTPAKIFAWVHDNIDWESYSGVAKGARGTLAERKGNDWDQALLLRDLLSSQGYQSQLEWGTVSLPIARAMNLAGTEDPLQAANLLATAGFDGVALTANNTPIAVQMTHAWVRAFIPYVPNRGARTGTPDTWVRMDPSFKRYDYDAGIAINGKVMWSEDEYLRTSAVRPPADFYGDKIWSYIRANNLNCQNLSQVAKNGRIHAENFPFVPSTLTARIESQGGVAADPPAAQVQRVSLVLTDSNNAPVATYDSAIADLWGRKLSLTFAPATSDDAAIINSYGGLFKTPAYLVSLRPVFSIDDVAVAQGAAVSAGADLDLNLTFRQPNVADDTTHHEVVAGETHTEVFDAGTTPDALITARINRLKQLTASNASEDAIVSEQLYLVGLRYMQHVDDGLNFAMGVRWQRGVKRVFEGAVRRQVNVSYNLGGAPLRLAPAENNIDISRLQVGVVPINNDQSNKAEALQLAGLESSYREAAIWEEMQSRQGISAAKALLLARIAGQQLYTVNSGNVETVLNSVNLPSDVEAEIRGSVAQGRIAKIASAPITLGHWSGTGYILEDPQTGAATFPISGGSAGGSATETITLGMAEILGTEPWLNGSPLGDILKQFVALVGGSSGPNNSPSTTQSDPVNMSSGNMFRTVSDVSIGARGVAVELRRTYNSRSSYNGPFGHGWTFNYGEMLIANPDGSVTLREGDGSEHVFANNSGTFVSPSGKHLNLVSDAGGSTMRTKTGLASTFDAQGRLTSQSDLNGNTVTINRDGAGNIRIFDAIGRDVLDLTSTGGHITQAKDLGNRITTFQYNGDDLVGVTDPTGAHWTYGYDLTHNMTELIDPVGNSQGYDYDTDDRLMHHVDAVGAEEFFHYDIAARSSVVTEKRGGDRFIQFDDRGRATTEADPAGNVAKATFDVDNNRTEILDSLGHASTYEFDGNGNTTKETTADGAVVAVTYGANSRPLTSTDANGVTTTNIYDAHGNAVQSSVVVGGVNQTTINSWDAHGQIQSTTDANGGNTSLSWNDNGSLASRTDAGGNATIIGTDGVGRITSLKDPAGNVTPITYDGRDRILSVTDSFGNATSFSFDAAGRRKSVTTPRGTTTFTYDGEGRVLSTRDPLGNITRTTWNAAGDAISRTDARGNVTRYEYDLIGRVTKMTDANGGVWSYGYCASIGSGAGRGPESSFCEVTDPSGNTLKREFDVMGRVVSVTDALSHAMFTQYDKNGRKTVETDASGNATHFAYDELGRVTVVTEASGSATSYTYDRVGNKLTQKDANGRLWSFRYDPLNRIIEEKDPLNRITSWTYDALGNVATKTDGNGNTARYAYNVRRLLSVTYADASVDTFTYDPLGRRITATNANAALTYAYDAANRITSVANATTRFTTAYAYDANGNRTKLSTFVQNGTSPYAVSQYSYDAKDRLTSINDSILGSFSFSYDAMDRRTRLQYANGTAANYAYDNAYRLTAIGTKDAQGNVIDAWSYQYDAVGNPTTKTNLDGKSDVYSYDKVYRLAAANYSDGSFEKFTYDAVGNRLTRTTEAGTSTVSSFDAANQLIAAGAESFTYDGNGNMLTKRTGAGTTTLTYNQRNLPITVATPAGTETNLYGPNGERTWMQGASIEGGNVFPENDLSGNPVMDSDGGLGVWTYRVYGPGMDEPLAEYRRNNDRKTYLHHDGLGSVTAVSNGSGQLAYRSTYKAFGEMSRSAYDLPTTRLGYTSRETSVGGLVQYRSRYYDPSAGRFLQQDSWHGSELLPPSLHRYAYVHNNPIRYNDPTGHVVNGLMATVGLIALSALLLGAAPDKIGHFLSGFGATVLLTIAIGWFVPNPNIIAAVLMLTFVAIIIGTFLEKYEFNTGGFDGWDWLAQTLGAAVSCAVFLLLLQEVSPIAEMGSEILSPLAYWSLSYLAIGAFFAFYGLAAQAKIKPLPQP
jgi:RHS repeat-associated protein